ncbi:MAG: hypothetical protein ACO2YR_03655 [Nitrosopumilaceae archaeon]
MSRYLKGKNKEHVLDLIRKYLAYRMTDEEMIMNLKDKGYELSDRTLRRFKLEIREISGKNITQVYQNEIVDNALEDIFAMREIQRQCWQEYDRSKVEKEKLKALGLIRKTILDKFKIYEQVPWKFRRGQPLLQDYDIQAATAEVVLEKDEE